MCFTFKNLTAQLTDPIYRKVMSDLLTEEEKYVDVETTDMIRDINSTHDKYDVYM